MTTEILMTGAIRRGLFLSDFMEMTIGMIFDYVITYNNMEYEASNDDEKIVLAKQSDFDAF